MPGTGRFTAETVGMGGSWCEGLFATGVATKLCCALGGVLTSTVQGLALVLLFESCHVSTATWLILPVVIRSSQRLSHASLSINLLL